MQVSNSRYDYHTTNGTYVCGLLIPIGPVVRIKQALTKLKDECTEMDVQIGLMEHTLLDLQYKTKTAIRLQMSGGANNKKSKTLF